MKSALCAGRSSRDPVAFRQVVWLALALGGAIAAPVACFYPSYSFDLSGGSGGATGAATTGSGGAPAGAGGSTTATTASTSSTSTTSSTSAGGSGGQGGAGTGGGHGGQGGTATGGGGGQGGAGGATTTTGAGGMGGSIDAGSCITADCSNPDCAPLYGCVETAPAGWTGYVIVYDGPAGNDPGCPTAFPDSSFLGNGGFSAAAATCTACSCAGPTGETCVLPTEIDSEDGMCGKAAECGGVLSTPAGWNGTCTGVDELPGGTDTCGAGSNCVNGTAACNVSVSTAAPTVTGGTCVASGGTATVPPVTWATVARGCGDPEMTAPGCNNGQLCLPKPETPFVGAVCVYQAGDVASCPPGVFSTKYVFYQGDTDDRGCSDCSCGTAAGSTCAATIRVYSDPTQTTCNTLVTSFPAGTCVDLNGNPTLGSREATITQEPSGGTCPAAGGAPIGTAAPALPTTFCCAG
jgi:hypothetical protein